MREQDVAVLIPCRDGERTLPNTINSLLNQSAKVFIAVADDASIDSTPQILKQFSETDRVRYVRYPKREPRNYGRVPVLLNMALKACPSASFYLISGDDSTYPTDYLAKIITFMIRDNVDIASGYFDKYNYNAVPSGSGRLLTATLFEKITPFPESIGWESWMLYKAMAMGKKLRVYPVKFSHDRKYSFRSTWTFGHSAYLNGIPFGFILLRSAKALVIGDHTPLNAISIPLGYMEYAIRRVEKLDTANFMSYLSRWRMKRFLMKKLRLEMK